LRLAPHQLKVFYSVRDFERELLLCPNQSTVLNSRTEHAGQTLALGHMNALRELPEHRPLRVLMVHNAYLQRGGEDGVVAAEVDLLRQHGHHVIEFKRDNKEIAGMSAPSLAAQTVWSRGTRADVSRLIRSDCPDVVHVHNTFPLVSPSLYWACAELNVPVVQTLHNFRLVCPQAMFLREGKVCESCLGRTPWPAVVHACYRSSRAQTSVLVGMLAVHKALHTFDRKVSRYIALSEFSREKFIEAGLRSDRIVVKPNFVENERHSESGVRRGFLFVGRLSPEKGIEVLGEAWRTRSEMSLRVAGTGDLGAALGAQEDVVMLGNLSSEQVKDEMKVALALVLPSICFENFPLVLVEAFASGLPVIASRIGALAELVEHGVTGLLFTPGDATDLAQKLRWAHAHPNEMAAMGRNARAVYQRRYTPEINLSQLTAIYRSAIAEAPLGVAHV
jgi:glycosyltransferase involved in cell wall biosynthesis